MFPWLLPSPFERLLKEEKLLKKKKKGYKIYYWRQHGEHNRETVFEGGQGGSRRKGYMHN